MRINLIRDLPQYDEVLLPVCAELTARGHTVVWTNTRPTTERNVDAHLAVQDVAYKIPRTGKGIRFFINHGSSIAKSWGLNFDIDHFLAPTQYWSEAAVKKIQDYEYVVSPPVGWPKVDRVLGYATPANKQDIITTFSLNPNRPIVCYYPTYKKSSAEFNPHWGRSYNAGELSRLLALRFTNLFVIPHQMDDTNEFVGLGTIRVTRAYNNFTMKLFAVADAIISDTSGCAFESCILDTPVVMVGDPNNPPRIEGTGPPIDFGPVCEPKDVPAAVETLLAKPDLYRKDRLDWREFIFGVCDGSSSRRVVDYMEEVV